MAEINEFTIAIKQVLTTGHFAKRQHPDDTTGLGRSRPIQGMANAKTEQYAPSKITNIRKDSDTWPGFKGQLKDALPRNLISNTRSGDTGGTSQAPKTRTEQGREISGKISGK